MANDSSYKKKGGSRLPFPAQEVERRAKLSESPSKQQVPLGYTKPKGTQSPTLLILVLGGNKREVDYFNLFLTTQKTSFPRVAIEAIYSSEEQPNGGLSPVKLYREAEKIKTISKDEIYLVCDVDDFLSELLEIMPLCKKKDYKLVVSNSCFEVWLYYGKHSAKPDEHVVPFACPANPLKISQAFKTYLGEIVPGGIDPKKAILYDIETAIENARKHYRQDEDGIPHLYSTNMFILADRLLELIKPELDEFRRRKQEEQEELKRQQNSRKKREEA